ncbi:SipW-dependent-type signal peptide-containing protein [Psychrobacillus sp. FSL K6-1464]|uniref:SipW-dependent-type signal peptide-containing protein n=1 Tax=Psychrobacillus sp. FSL K6-1464 TaxID=2921545 RepID=UPI0030FC78D0
MKSKRRRRYKRKKYDFILISKIALICYLAIFGLGYLTSDTSAYLSSQSEVSQTITAGIWEVPEILVNACGEEYTIDEVTGDEILVNPKDSDENPTEANEDDLDCEAKDEIPEEIIDLDPAEELLCESKDGTIIGDENDGDSASSEKVKADCENKDDKSNEEIDKDKVVEDVETIEPINEKQNELENGNNEENKENTNKEDSVNSKEGESTKQPSDITPTDKDTTTDNATDSNSTKNKNTEINDAVKPETNIEKVEGDTNEI